MPVGDVRTNPVTGDTWQLTRVGNDLVWQEQGDDVALRAAEQGPVGGFAAGLLDTVTLGMAPEAPITEQARRQFPGAFTAGQALPLVAEFGPRVLGGAGRRVLTQLDAAATRTARQASGEAAGARQLIRRPSDIAGRATVTGQGLRAVEAGADVIPLVNLPGLLQKAVNQRRINESFARAMQLGDDAAAHARVAGVDELTTSRVLQKFDEGYGQITTAVDEGLEQAAARGAIDQAAEAGYISQKLQKVLDQGRITAKDVMGLRSELAKLARSNENFLVIRNAEEMLSGVDGIIARALERAGDDASTELFRSLNARYRIWRNLRKGRGIGADGQINPRTADGRFLNDFGDQYLAGQVQTSDQGVNDFLRITREGASLDVGLPSSGTAERLGNAALLAAGGAALTQ